MARARSSEKRGTGTSRGTNPVAIAYPHIATADQVSYGVGAWLMTASLFSEL